MTIGEIAVVFSVLFGTGTAVIGGMKLSAQLGRVLQSIDHLVRGQEDHETRLRKLEGE